MSRKPEKLREDFLKDLAKLSGKYGLTIHGCGCCSSPWVSEAPKKGHYTIDESGQLRFTPGGYPNDKEVK